MLSLKHSPYHVRPLVETSCRVLAASGHNNPPNIARGPGWHFRSCNSVRVARSFCSSRQWARPAPEPLFDPFVRPALLRSYSAVNSSSLFVHSLFKTLNDRCIAHLHAGHCGNLCLGHLLFPMLGRSVSSLRIWEFFAAGTCPTFFLELPSVSEASIHLYLCAVG